MIQIRRHGQIADFGEKKNEFTSAGEAVKFLDEHLRGLETRIADAGIAAAPSATRAGWHLTDTNGALDLLVDRDSGKAVDDRAAQKKANADAAAAAALAAKRAPRRSDDDDDTPRGGRSRG